MKKILTLLIIIFISGCSQQVVDNVDLTNDRSDEAMYVETELTRAHRDGVLDLDDFQTVDGVYPEYKDLDLRTPGDKYVIQNKTKNLVEVIFDSQLIQEYKNLNVAIKDFRVVDDRFVVYKLYLDDLFRYVVFDLDLGVEYKLDSVGDYGEFFYDETVQKLLVCDEYRYQTKGNLQLVDLRFGTVKNIYGPNTYLINEVIVGCDGFDEDSKKYVFSLVSDEDFTSLKKIENALVDNAWSSSLELGYEQDLEQFIPESQLSLEQLVKRFFDLLNMNKFEYAHKMLSENQMTKEDFETEFRFNEYTELLAINKLEGNMFEATVKIVFYDKALDEVDSLVKKMIWNFDADKKMQLHDIKVIDSAVVGSFMDGRIEHVVKDGLQQVLFDGELVYTTCDAVGSDVCNYSLISDFELVTENIFKFDVSHYEGKESFLINLQTGNVSKGLFLFDYENVFDSESTVFIENKLLHCRDTDAFDGDIFVMNLDTFEIEKRFDPKGEYFGIVCLGFDKDRNAYAYKLYSSEQLSKFAHRKTKAFLQSLESQFFGLE